MSEQDPVNILQLEASIADADDMPATAYELRRAADEIERLREEVRQLKAKLRRLDGASISSSPAPKGWVSPTSRKLMPPPKWWKQ
jgi:hypothetical protein